MANNINTVEKGDIFEDRVFSKFKELLKKGQLGLDPKSSSIYRKKSYKVKEGNYIEFDISIETYMPNAGEPSYLTLIECKDYNTSIHVDKIRVFSHQINDVKAQKGFFITTSKFQKGALDVAKRNGIALAIMNNTNDIEWKLHRIGKRSYQIRQDVEEYFTDIENANKYPFIAISGNHYYTSVIDFLSDMIGQELKLPIEIPFIEPKQIEEEIASLFKEKNRKDQNYIVKTEELIDLVKNQLKVDLNFTDTLSDEIGHCDFKNNRISITKAIEYDSPRWRFTLAHEIGHYILHRYLHEKYDISIANDDDINLSELSEDSTKWLEWQANIFALKILIPDEAFNKAYFQLHRKLGLHNFPLLYVDSQPCNRDSYFFIIKDISQRFGVSQEVVRNRLLKLGYLELEDSVIFNSEEKNPIEELTQKVVEMIKIKSE